MKISVVIPAYNAEKSIVNVIASCKKQSRLPDEIVVVLDGCRDRTEEVVKGHFPDVRLIVLKENKGVSYARNEGIKQASGDWIAFLDADDEWHPDKLKIFTFYADKIKDASGFMNPYSTKDFQIFVSPYFFTVRKVTFFKSLFQNKVQGASLFLKKSKGFYFDERFRYCEDHELTLRLSWEGCFYQIPYILTKLSRAQLATGGLSGNRWAMRKGEMKMYSELGKFNFWLNGLIPFFIVMSLLKHLMKKVRT